MKTFAGCYGWRDELCIIEAKNKEEAMEMLEEKVTQVLMSTYNVNSKRAARVYLNEIACYVCDKKLADITEIDYQ